MSRCESREGGYRFLFKKKLERKLFHKASNGRITSETKDILDKQYKNLLEELKNNK